MATGCPSIYSWNELRVELLSLHQHNSIYGSRTLNAHVIESAGDPGYLIPSMHWLIGRVCCAVLCCVVWGFSWLASWSTDYGKGSNPTRFLTYGGVSSSMLLMTQYKIPHTALCASQTAVPHTLSDRSCSYSRNIGVNVTERSLPLHDHYVRTSALLQFTEFCPVNSRSNTPTAYYIILSNLILSYVFTTNESYFVKDTSLYPFYFICATTCLIRVISIY